MPAGCRTARFAFSAGRPFLRRRACLYRGGIRDAAARGLADRPGRNGVAMKRRQRGFTLIEVMAAFVIALVLIVPVASIISGISGSFGGLQRSVERRANLQLAAAAAMAVNPLRTGDFTLGDFRVEVRPRVDEQTSDLR